MTKQGELSASTAIRGMTLKGGGPLYLRVAEGLMDLVERDVLGHGCPMPRVRDLAEMLHVSVVTAHRAYRELEARGLLAGRAGVGTFVARRRSEPSLPASAGKAWHEAFVRSGPPTSLDYVFRLPKEVGNAPYSFVSLSLYDALRAPTQDTLRRIALDAEVHRSPATESDARGLPELRAGIAAFLGDEGLPVCPDQVLVTNGYEESLLLAFLSFCHEGDTVAMEDPNQWCHIDTARRFGLKLQGIPVDGGGMRTDALASLAEREKIRLVIASPRAHNPAGVDMSAERRAELLRLASHHNWLIFEGDRYAPHLRYGSDLLPLFSLDSEGRVIYSRWVVRRQVVATSAIVATGRILEELVQTKDVIQTSSDHFVQLVAHRLLEDKSVSRQEELFRHVWEDQRHALVAAVQRYVPSSVAWTRPHAIGCMWLTLPDGCSSEALLKRALDKGVSFVPGRAFSVAAPHGRSFRLAVGTMLPAKITEGIKRLGPVIARYVDDVQRGTARAKVS